MLGTKKLYLDKLETSHPAAKQLLQAWKEHQNKFGDASNLLIQIAGQHLKGAKELLNTDGLNRNDIVDGYAKATTKLDEILRGLVKDPHTIDLLNKNTVSLILKASIYGIEGEDDLCPLIAEACVGVYRQDPSNVNLDNVRVYRVGWKGVSASKTLRGMVLDADSLVGSIKSIEKAHVVVITIETVLTSSNNQVKELIEEVAIRGAHVIASGAALGEMALQICKRYNIMVLQIASESELHRFRRTTKAIAANLASGPCYLGYADSIKLEKIHGLRVIVTNERSGVSTILLGGTPENDLSHLVYKGVSIYQALCKDRRVVPGAGATEIEIATKLKEYSWTATGSDRKTIAKYAQSFLVIPRQLAESIYLELEDIISAFNDKQTSGNVIFGIDLYEEVCKDASTLAIWDLYAAKSNALEAAAAAVRNILLSDQMSRRIKDICLPFDCRFPPTEYTKIQWSGIPERKNGITEIGFKYNLDIRVLCIKKIKGNDDERVLAIGESLRDVGDRNTNVVRIHGIVNIKDTYHVLISPWGKPLRKEYIENKNVSPLVWRILNGLQGLHQMGQYIENFTIQDVFVDDNLDAKVSPINQKTVFPRKKFRGATEKDNMEAAAHVIFFCFTKVPYDKNKHHLYHFDHLHTLTVEKELVQRISPKALDLLNKLLNGSYVYSAKQAKKHIYFYTKTMTMELIRAVVESGEDEESTLRKRIENLKDNVFGSRCWKDFFSDNFLDVMKKGSFKYKHVQKRGAKESYTEDQQPRNYDFRNVFHLLLIIRHVLSHEAYTKDLANKIYPNDKELEEMFTGEGLQAWLYARLELKFPKLTTEVWNTTYAHREEPKFHQFYT